MLKDIFNWLLDKGLIFATVLINSISATITIAVIVIALLIDDWINRNWP